MRIFFVDFWPNFNYQDNYFYHLLSSKYNVIIDADNPDILFCSCYGISKTKYVNYKCRKIFFTGENRGIQSHDGNNWVDLNIGYDLTLTFMPTESNNVYFPLFVQFLNWFNVPFNHSRDISFLADIDRLITPHDNTFLEKTGGCCFLVNNQTAQDRIQFCLQAMNHFHVDCGGSVLNNITKIGGRGDQIEKIYFIQQYKTIIAFENSCYDGYLTEKLLHALYCRCIPIYWGSSKAPDYFNSNNFIQVYNSSDWPTAINLATQAMNNSEVFYNKTREPAMKRRVLEEFDPARILELICSP